MNRISLFRYLQFTTVCVFVLQADKKGFSQDIPSYIGEIRMTSATFAPPKWAFCDGQTLSIREHKFLYATISDLFGSDGSINFRLPDLRHLEKEMAGEQGKVDASLSKEKETRIRKEIEDAVAQKNYQLAADLKKQLKNPEPGKKGRIRFMIAIDKGSFPSKSERMQFDLYIGEISLFAGNYVPAGWRHADGSAMKRNQHDALFAIIKDTFGSDKDTFNLPDFRAREKILRKAAKIEEGFTYLIGDVGIFPSRF